MQTLTQITFQGLPPSDALQAAIRAEAAALERYFGGMMSCAVTVSEPHRHQHQGRLYRVKIHMAVPGDELVVDHEHGLHPGHEDPYLAVREAFHAARRELGDYVRRMRGDVKHHDDRLRGRVIRLVPWEDCGFIAAADGRELYFHRNSLLRGEFDSLRIGNEVTFLEEQAEKGPNAKSIRVVSQRPTEVTAEASPGQ